MLCEETTPLDRQALAMTETCFYISVQIQQMIARYGPEQFSILTLASRNF